MKEIKLQNGMVAIVDEEDYPLVASHHWYAHKSRNRWYARANAKVDGARTTIKMHRLIATPNANQAVDHRDRNGLNNTRQNLRCVGASLNRINQDLRKDNSCGYRGVSKASVGKRWIMQISDLSGKRIKQYFRSAMDAARAYDEHATVFHGNDAQLNFPERA